jgi:4-hydroxythreonine-4-phosphate dehydrogenase
MKSDYKVKIGISIGDLNGIGLEVIIKTLADARVLENIIPIIYGSGKVISFHKKTLDLPEFSYTPIRRPLEALPKKVNLINVWNDEIALEFGQASTISGSYAFKSLEAATNDLKLGNIDVLVTAPIDKKTIQNPEFKFAGHTEYLAEQAGISNYLMLLLSDELKIGTVTGHIPISEVAQSITKEKIIKKIEVLNNSLIKDFGIRKPKIAVLGLNPHAGDTGLIGKEEIEIIIPAITNVKEKGILAYGPYAADGLFGSYNFKKFDAVLGMFHDQALIPFKTLSFEDGVNFTAGLPFVRTSPDHGTGYDIAGKNKASEKSFRASLFAARDIFMTRSEHAELTSNPLKTMVKEIER